MRVMSYRIEIADYTAQWARSFEALRGVYERHLGGLIVSVEHVGSTSVEGLAAKPILDIDIVIEDAARLPAVAERLAHLGYAHRGDWGIEGREVFRAVEANVPRELAAEQWYRHNLYVCLRGCTSLRNHLAVRAALRADAALVAAYGALKRRLAAECGDDLAQYVERKTAFLLEILQKSGFTPDELSAIEAANKAKK